MNRLFVGVGAVMGFLAVAAGAFGAHALRDRLPADRLVLFELAAKYQMYHALALLAVGLIAERVQGATVNAAGYAFIIGTLIFCGTIYAMAFGAPRWFGAITPLGGVGLLIGWALLVVSAFRRNG